MFKVDSLLRQLAQRYETAEFLRDDPSHFMHQVVGQANQETMAFVAAALSYGSRQQFFPKIQFALDRSHGDIYEWVRQGRYADDIPDDDRCYYRLYTNHTMRTFLQTLRQLLTQYDTLGRFVSQSDCQSDAFRALSAIVRFFAVHGPVAVIPKDTRSACKRLCMFLRWMVRDGSPVDLGLWSETIDKRTLIMPLDTHVLTQSRRLQLISSSSGTMHTAQRLTDRMRQIFPEDPLKGDFALFGYGINQA